MRSYKFRIYPTRAQEKEMHKHLWLAKDLWNELLAHCRQTYGDFGRFPAKTTLITMTRGYGMFSQAQQQVAIRLYKAILRFLKLKKQGKKAGFPRFKSIDRSRSICYPQAGFSLNKKLKVNPFGELAIVKHREFDGKIKTLTLKREASGKWHAIFVVDVSKREPMENNGGAVGLDLGLKNFATLSDGKVIENPRHLKKCEDKLAFLQRRMSKKKKGSHNWKRARFKVVRIHGKVSNTRSDFLHKLATKLVNAHSLIVMEDLQSQKMAERDFGKQINDAGWGMFANMLGYKAESAGCRVIFVNPKDTTKTCNNCGAVKDMPLQERTYCCPHCGNSVDRDLNASRNILKRATAGSAGSNACGDATMVASGKQEAHLL